MKKLSFLFLCLLPVLASSQNAAPQISNLSLTHDPVLDRVTFTFDATDAESDNLEIALRISADSGSTWLAPTDSLSGDVGYPIAPGAGKSIVWHYDAQALSDLGAGPRAFRARIIADDHNSPDIADITAQVDSTRLVGDLLFLEGTRHVTAGAVHLQETRDSLQSLISASGLQAWPQDFAVGSFTRTNYIARYAGLLDEAVTYGVSGHYDCVSVSPGADDNGTATAAVMEALRVLSAYEFRHSIRYFAFDAEENGLKGSIAYVQDVLPKWEDFRGLINMEMVGYYDDAANSQNLPFGFDQLFPAATAAIEGDSSRGNFLTNVANTTSTPLMQAFDSCAALYVPELRVISLATPGTGSSTPDLRRSDHAPFWDAGLQALMLTDGADFRNYHYHTAGDSVGTLDMQFFYRNVKAVVATLAKLADPLHADAAVSDTFLIDVPVAVKEEMNISDLRVSPNPSSGLIRVEWTQEGAAELRLSVWDASGRRVALLSEGIVEQGVHRLEWNGKSAGLSAGTYFLAMEQKGERIIRSFVLQ